MDVALTNSSLIAPQLLINTFQVLFSIQYFQQNQLKKLMEDNIVELIDIIYREYSEQDDFGNIWKRSNVRKFIQFIKKNCHYFFNQTAKRKSQIFLRAATEMGPGFTNVKLRKKFDWWLKKYGTLENMIRSIERNIHISERNQRLFSQLEKKRQLDRMQKKQKAEKQEMQKKGEKFFMKNGQIHFFEWQSQTKS